MIDLVAGALNALLAVVRPLVFAAGVVAAAGAAASWAVRTRRLSPFSGAARLIRTAIDPWLVAPMERRLLRAGGTPGAAPWWGLAVVVIGGLLLISALQFVRDQLLLLLVASGSGASLMAVLLRWTFSVLRLALIARVIASWVGGGPYSKGWRWAYALTEWFLAPLRQVIPPLGMFDLTVLIAYFGLGLVERLMLSVLVF
jgi:YggT family protein